MTIDYIGLTDVGLIRQNNEDNFVNIFIDLMHKKVEISEIGSTELISGRTAAAFVVADGMGGAAAGEVASQIAVDTAVQEFKGFNFSFDSDDSIIDLLKHIVLEGHEAIKKHAFKNPKSFGMGTTLTIGVFYADKLYVVWSGDSRVYRYAPLGVEQFKHYDLESLEIITPDHSVVWDMVEKREISAEQARTHEQSNVITQSLGDPAMAPAPDFRIIDLYQNDKILLCSDGLNGMMADFYINQILSTKLNVEQTAEMLINAAKSGGGSDNITLALVEIQKGQLAKKILDNTETIITKKAAVIPLPTPSPSKVFGTTEKLSIPEIEDESEAEAEIHIIEKRKQNEKKTSRKNNWKAFVTAVGICLLALWGVNSLFSTEEEPSEAITEQGAVTEEDTREEELEEPVAGSRIEVIDDATNEEKDSSEKEKKSTSKKKRKAPKKEEKNLPSSNNESYVSPSRDRITAPPNNSSTSGTSKRDVSDTNKEEGSKLSEEERKALEEILKRFEDTSNEIDELKVFFGKKLEVPNDVVVLKNSKENEEIQIVLNGAETTFQSHSSVIDELKTILNQNNTPLDLQERKKKWEQQFDLTTFRLKELDKLKSKISTNIESSGIEEDTMQN